MIKKIIVIGGGPAGLLAAYSASLSDDNVVLIEKNSSPGKKILITGKGRCNITNNCDEETLIKNVKTNSKFLYSAFYTFGTKDIVNLLNINGLKTKTERGNRVFPVSNNAEDVAKALTNIAIKNNVRIRQDVVTNIEKKNDLWKVVCEKTTYLGDKIIIATGGLSYPTTGSTGDGYAFAKKLGHKIISTQPSLIPIEIKERSVKDMMGLSLKNVTLSVYNKVTKKTVFSMLGEMLFTHFGISGPLVLSASAHMDIKKIINYDLYIDWKPALDNETLDNRLQSDFIKYANKDFKNAFDDLLPKKAIPVFVRLSRINENKKVHQITKEERKNILNLFKKMKFTPTNFRPIREAVITSGGIDVNEIKPSTMESKLHSGLYFAGEIIDVDAYTGGFNLQIAYSTGYLAGLSASNCLKI